MNSEYQTPSPPIQTLIKGFERKGTGPYPRQFDPLIKHIFQLKNYIFLLFF